MPQIKKTETTFPEANELNLLMHKAYRAGEEVARTTEDTGTCNFDTCVVYGTPEQRRRLMTAARDAGFDPMESRYFGEMAVALLGLPWGQGLSRTLASEAVCRVLKEAGIAGTVHYQMD